MSYNNKGYLLRARRIRDETYKHYEKGNQAKSFHSIWRNYIRKMFGISYQTYLKYLKAANEEAKKDFDSRQLSLWDDDIK